MKIIAFIAVFTVFLIVEWYIYNRLTSKDYKYPLLGLSIVLLVIAFKLGDSFIPNPLGTSFNIPLFLLMIIPAWIVRFWSKKQSNKQVYS